MIGDLEKSRRLYQTLQLPDFSAIDEVRQAYKSLALKYHPDKNLNDPSAAERFRDVRVAYEVLSNVERKQKYDSTLRMFKPLSANSFPSRSRAHTPGASRPASATTETGFNPYMSTGNGASSLYEELNSYTTKRAERRNRRTSSVGAMREDRASQYTQEQKDFFKKREKEHQAELRKRREQEKREQRAKELETLRRKQEKREEVQQRIYQQRVATEPRRSHSSVSYRRPSPFVKTSMGNRSPAETNREGSKTLPRESHVGVKLPDTVRPVQSPRPRVTPSETEMVNVDRVRREKERQSEVRRAEQEKYLERLMRRRILEARLKERDAREEEQREHRKLRQLLINSETSEREQFLVPQEHLERRRLWLKYRKEVQHCWLAFYTNKTMMMEMSKRSFLDTSAEVQLKGIYLQTREAWGRAKCHQEGVLAWENLVSSHFRRYYEICVYEQAGLIRNQSVKCDLLYFQEAVEFDFIEIRRQEAENWLKLVEKCKYGLSMHFNAIYKLKKGELMKSALTDTRNMIVSQEQSARAVLWAVFDEWSGRCALKQSEEDSILQLIKQRACERHVKYLLDVQEAKLAERRVHTATILALQQELQQLKSAENSTSFTDKQEKGKYAVVAAAPCFVNSLRVNEFITSPRSGADGGCNDFCDTGNVAHNGNSYYSKSSINDDDHHDGLGDSSSIRVGSRLDPQCCHNFFLCSPTSPRTINAIASMTAIDQKTLKVSEQNTSLHATRCPMSLSASMVSHK